MDKLEQELVNIFDNIEGDEDVRQFDNCYSLLEKHCIGFGEFLGKYPDKNRNYKGEVLHAESKYDGAETTEELFKLYIEQL